MPGYGLLMEPDQRQRTQRRDEDLRRLKRLTIGAGVLSAGLLGATSLVAAASQPGRAIPATSTTPQETAIDSSTLAGSSSLQGPGQAPLPADQAPPMVMSGGS